MRQHRVSAFLLGDSEERIVTDMMPSMVADVGTLLVIPNDLSPNSLSLVLQSVYAVECCKP